MTTTTVKGFRTPSLISLLLRACGWLLVAIAVVLIGFVSTAIVLGLIPVNASFVEARDGVPIYVRTNGVHAELILPTRAAGVDWSVEHPATHMRALARPRPWVAFGWGDLGFFANTPTWSDLRLTTAVSALTGGGPGALHVEYVESPRGYKGREIWVSPEQYARLVAYIRSSVVRDAAGRPRRASLPGYFDYDAFYEAQSGYRSWFTCNDWVRTALREAGVRVPMWSPFDTALFYQLQKIKK